MFTDTVVSCIYTYVFLKIVGYFGVGYFGLAMTVSMYFRGT